MSTATVHNTIPDPEIEAAVPQILRRAEAMASLLWRDGFAPMAGGFADALVGGVLRQTGASEGSIWLADEAASVLVPVWNNGPDAESFPRQFAQPLARGIVSMVCLSESPFCENEVYNHASYDGSIDNSVGKLTCSMAAVPLRFGGCTRGVISAVKLKDRGAEADPPPFGAEVIATLATASAAFGAWLDQRIFETVLGLRRG